jgi:hypothetical protein
MRDYKKTRLRIYPGICEEWNNKKEVWERYYRLEEQQIDKNAFWHISVTVVGIYLCGSLVSSFYFRSIVLGVSSFIELILVTLLMKYLPHEYIWQDSGHGEFKTLRGVKEYVKGIDCELIGV